MDGLKQFDDKCNARTLDDLEKQIRSYDVDPTNFQLKGLIVATLQLLGMCKRMQKTQADTLLHLVTSIKTNIEEVLKSSMNATTKEFDKVLDLTMKLETPSHLVQLARTLPYDIGYDHTHDLILISLFDKDSDYCESCLSIKYVKSDDYERYYILNGYGLPDHVQDIFLLPLKFKTLDEIVEHLKYGWYESVKVHVLSFHEQDDKNPLAASAVFRTE